MVLISLMPGLIVLRGVDPAHAQGATGAHKVLVIPASFSDVPLHPNWQTDLTNVLNRVNAFYTNVSGSQLDLQFTVHLPPISMGVSTPYGDSDGAGTDDPGRLIRDVVAQVDPAVDFGQFDTLMIVHSADDDLHNDCPWKSFWASNPAARQACLEFGASAAPPNKAINSGVYEATTPGGQTLPYPTSDLRAGQRMYVNRAIILSERYHDNTSPNPPDLPQDDVFGVYVHEMGHEIGARFPDLYDPGGWSWGIGYWGVMGTGYDLPEPNERRGKNPGEPSAWTKWYMGWASVTVQGDRVSSSGATNLMLPPMESSNRSIFRINLKGGGIDNREYFLLETRDQCKGTNCTNHDTRLPGDGLLIWHVDERLAAHHVILGSLLTRWDENVLESTCINGVPRDKFIDLEEADGRNDLDAFPCPGNPTPTPYPNQNQGDATDPYAGVSASSFGIDRSQTNLGQPTGIALNNIARNPTTGEVSFDLTMPFRVENIIYTPPNTVQVLFNKPVDPNKVVPVNFFLSTGFTGFHPDSATVGSDPYVAVLNFTSLGISRSYIYTLQISGVTSFTSESLPADPTSLQNAIGTTAQGLILKGTTWTRSGSPYWIVDDIVVDKSATLTIEPGTIMLFKPTPGISIDLPTGQNDITVWGCLVVKGTPTNPVIFTSSADFPALSDWGSIQIIESPTERPRSIITEKRACQNRIAYADISYGTEAVVGSPASFSLTHSNLHHNATALALFDNPDQADVAAGGTGVDFSRSVPTIYNNNFQNNCVDIRVGSQRPTTGTRSVGRGASIAAWQNWFSSVMTTTDGSPGAFVNLTPALAAPVDQGFTTSSIALTLNGASVSTVRPGSTINIRVTGRDVDSSRRNAYALTAVSPSAAALVAMRETPIRGEYAGTLNVGSLTATPFGTIGSQGGESIVLTAGRLKANPTQVLTTTLGVCRDEDIDCDCDVQSDDVQAVAGQWHKPAGPPFDVNKDGNQDVVDVMRVAAKWGDVCQMPASPTFTMQPSRGAVYVALSNPANGSRFQPQPFATVWHPFFGIGEEMPAVSDFNGDGLDDIAAFARSGGNQGNVYVATSDGSSFQPKPFAPIWHGSIAIGQEVPATGDFDGDGRDDVISFAR
jgi:hypothetical protein